jgi:DNA-binding MarR family transcriptional regulator
MNDKDEDISISDYQALAEFRYRIRQFQRFSEQVARAAGIEPQQHQTLLVIKGMPEKRAATIGDVAERLQIQHHSAVELIDRLKERGLVERRRDEADQRRVFVHLTQQGEEILRNISRHTLTELRTNGPALVGALNALLVGIIDGKDSQG